MRFKIEKQSEQEEKTHFSASVTSFGVAAATTSLFLRRLVHFPATPLLLLQFSLAARILGVSWRCLNISLLSIWAVRSRLHDPICTIRSILFEKQIRTVQLNTRGLFDGA